MPPPRATPFVSVVIPHRGDDTLLGRCLEALRQQTYPRDLFEVLVVVNEPEKRSLECELHKGEFLLWEPHYFSYSARNLGIENAQGDVVALTDSDTIPSPDWVSEGVAALRESQADVVAGHITVTASKTRPSPPALYELMFAFDQEKNVRGRFSATANLFVARHLFTEHGLFDQTAQTGEDFEWTAGAVDGGATLVYSSSAIVKHPARESWSALLAKARRTALPFANAAATSPKRGGRLRTRIQFHLRTRPSPSKVRALTRPQRLVARLVHVLILAHKALCLLRVPPVVDRDFEAGRAERAAQDLFAQVASAQRHSSKT